MPFYTNVNLIVFLLDYNNAAVAASAAVAR